MTASQATARRERLLGLDPLPRHVQSRCEAAIDRLLKRKLSAVQRLWGWASIVVNLVIAGGLLVRLGGRGAPLTLPAELVVVPTILLLGLSAWLAHVLMRGSVHLLRDSLWLDAVGCVGMLLIGTILLGLTWQANDLAASLKLAIPTALLFYGGTAWAAFVSWRQRTRIRRQVAALEQELAVRNPAVTV